MEKPVTFRSQKQQLVGMLHLPDGGTGPAPAVVFLHGFRGNKQEAHRIFVKMARALAGAGIVALRFDFRGSGDSEGDFVNATIAGEVKDARAALRFIRRRPEVDPARVALLGMSMGGMVAVLTAAEDPGLKALALWSAVGTPSRSAERRSSPERSTQLATAGYADMDGWAVGMGFVRELMTLRPLGAVERITAPALLIHGDMDTSVPVEDVHAYEAAFRAAGREVAKHIIHGSEHTYDSVPWETEVLNLTLDWLRQHV